MSPWRRTFSLFFIFLTLQKGPVFCQTVGPGIPQNSVPISKEYGGSCSSSHSKLLKTLLTIASANGVLPKVLPAIQKIFPESQKLLLNDDTVPSPMEASSGSSCQQCSTPNMVVNTPNSIPIYPTILPSNCDVNSPVTLPSCPPSSQSNLIINSPNFIPTYPAVPQPNIVVNNPISLPLCSPSTSNTVTNNPNPIAQCSSTPNANFVRKSPNSVSSCPLISQPSSNPIPPPSALPLPQPKQTVASLTTTSTPVPPCQNLGVQTNFAINIPNSVPYPVIPQSNLALYNPNVLQSYPILPPLPPPSTFIVPSLVPQPTIPNSSPISCTEQTYNSMSPNMGPLRPTPIFTQPVNQFEMFSPYSCLPDVMPPQFNLQLPSIPPIPVGGPCLLPPVPISSSFVSIIQPDMLPIVTPELVPITNVGSNTESDWGQHLPISLHINLPAPILPEPIITVISTSQPAPVSSTTPDFPTFGMPPCPIHIVERSRSRWKTWLPLLLVALLDGCCCNNNYCGGGGSNYYSCSSSIPVPYPIPVPTNNPIILGCGFDD